MELKTTYERVVKVHCTGRVLAVRLLAYLGYACFAGLWIAPILRSLFSPLVIALAVLSTVILIVSTKKYLHVEYEYAFVEGFLTVSKIFDKKRRKTVVEIELKKVLLVAYDNNDSSETITRLSPTKTVNALSSPDSDAVLVAIFDDEEEKDTRIALLLEADDTAAAFFCRYAPHACSREMRSNLR